MSNAGNEAQVKKAAEQEAQRVLRELADWKWVMSDARCRRVMQEIIAEANIFGEVFNANGSITNLNLGMRKLGLFVYGKLDVACPENILLMRQEHLKETQ